MTDWRNELDKRQQDEVSFALMYDADFAHGTDGHSRLMLIAKLARLLDSGYGQPVAVTPPKRDPSQPFVNLRKPQGIA